MHLRCLFVLLGILPLSAAFALNGLRPIGTSSASRSLGGTGVGAYLNDLESLSKNPALLGYGFQPQAKKSVHWGLTYGSFQPKVRATYGEDQEFKRPVNKTKNVFPHGIGLGYHFSPEFSYALGIFGGGGGADYGEAATVYKARSRTRAFTFAQGVSWSMSEKTKLGVNLSISRVETQASNESVISQKRVETGGTDHTPGVLLGVSHKLKDFKLGLALQSKQTALLREARDIDQNGVLDDVYFTAVPFGASVGMAWGNSRYEIYGDYNFLQWSKAEFLESTGWRDQHVLAIGAEYKMPQHKFRIGYNKSNKAVYDQRNNDGFGLVDVSNKKMIRLAGDAFASTSGLGITTDHFTLGSAHQINTQLSIETAMVRMREATLKRSGSYGAPGGRKQYGWETKFKADTYQVEMLYRW